MVNDVTVRSVKGLAFLLLSRGMHDVRHRLLRIVTNRVSGQRHYESI